MSMFYCFDFYIVILHLFEFFFDVWRMDLFPYPLSSYSYLYAVDLYLLGF